MYAYVRYVLVNEGEGLEGRRAGPSFVHVEQRVSGRGVSAQNSAVRTVERSRGALRGAARRWPRARAKCQRALSRTRTSAAHLDGLPGGPLPIAARRHCCHTTLFSEIVARRKTEVESNRVESSGGITVQNSTQHTGRRYAICDAARCQENSRKEKRPARALPNPQRSEKITRINYSNSVVLAQHTMTLWTHYCIFYGFRCFGAIIIVCIHICKYVTSDWQRAICLKHLFFPLHTRFTIEIECLFIKNHTTKRHKYNNNSFCNFLYHLNQFIALFVQPINSRQTLVYRSV